MHFGRPEHVSEVRERIGEIRSRLEELRGLSRSRSAASLSGRGSGALPPFPVMLGEALGVYGSEDAGSTTEFDDLIRQAGEKHGVDPAIIKALIKCESGFRPDAVSPAGAQGLMQLMPGTTRALGVSDPFDPAACIDGGTRYLRQLIDRFGGHRLALAAYNAGPAQVLRFGGVPPFAETQNFVSNVLKHAEAYRSASEEVEIP